MEDIVIIGSDNRKRTEWPLGRTTELLSGTEGVVKLVKFQKARGELIKLAQHLYLLEIITSEVNKVLKYRPPNTKVSQQRERTPVVTMKEIQKNRYERTIKGTEWLDL